MTLFKLFFSFELYVNMDTHTLEAFSSIFHASACIFIFQKTKAY